MKHNYTVAQIIFGWIIIFGSYYTGQWMASDDHEDELERIVDWNTKQIHSLGIAAATDSYNADLIIQILNLMEGREVKPPSRSAISDMLLSEDVIEDDDVPHTFEQIEKDQREVDQSIRAFASSNLFQAETLENILNKLQNGHQVQ